MMHLAAMPALLVFVAVSALAATQPEPFSAAQPGATPPGWSHTTLPGVPRPSKFDLVDDAGTTVLRIRSPGAASSLTRQLSIDTAQNPVLSWRWKVSAPVAGSDLRRKQGDDYAARLYVLFDYPIERLSISERMAISAARLLHGADIPTAALCYVWGTAQAVGTIAPNPYTDRVRMIVLQSGADGAGAWHDETRDLRADFLAAFGEPPPAVAGIALGADTDNTGEKVEARFGDVRFRAAP